MTMFSKRQYSQKFRDFWLKDPILKDWLQVVEDNDGNKVAKCRLCGVRLRNHYADLKSHTTTKKHQENAKMRVDISTAGEASKGIASNVDSCATGTESEGSLADATVEISTNLKEEPSTSAPSTCSKTTCLFCNHERKKCGKQILNLRFAKTEEAVQKIKDMAESLNDANILLKITNQTVAYHQSCYAAYQSKEKWATEEHTDSSWHKYRNVHKLAFESLCDFITTEIICYNQVVYFAQLFSRYQALLLEYGDRELNLDDFQDYRPEILQKKILKKFGDRIIIEVSTSPRCQKIVHQADIEVSVMATNMKLLETRNDQKFEDVAYYLRKCIKNINPRRLPSHLTADDIIRGECEIPQMLFYFMESLIPNVSEENRNQVNVKIASICSDIIYTVTKGRCKPVKSLMLGLAMKSLTNSRQVITMLNRYGHTIGHNLAEELETEMTYTSVQDNNVIPTDIKSSNGHCTHVAFDNFDRFVDTTSGKDTMHDTVGIIYQFPSTSTDDSGDETVETREVKDNVNSEAPARKRRRFNEIVREIRPYYSKPTASLLMLPVDSFTNTLDICRGSKEIAIDKDLLWVMSLSRINSVPMWLGYNCMTKSSDGSEQQKIEYLSPINNSPTSYAIVNETLIIANEIAEKCSQPHIIVTYDLAIAKMAMQIQEKERPKFDKVFVNLGAFHMEIAFFKTIGKYIDSSGLVEILVQAEVLAGGSMNSYLDSKHFNRCKRLHPLTAAALQILHFEQYLSTTNVSPEALDELLQAQIQNASNQAACDVSERVELPDLFTVFQMDISSTAETL